LEEKMRPDLGLRVEGSGLGIYGFGPQKVGFRVEV
jgi:hypothetical protein